MQIRCPHCQATLDYVSDETFTDMACPTCGSDFNLLGDDTEITTPANQAIGHFQLVDCVGQGAFGAVWKALDTQLDRTVAIKIPRRESLTAADAEKFLREARAVAQLRHPGIVTVFEVGRDADRIYLVSEFIEGITLADWLTGQQATPREAAEMCLKLATALHHAHEAGVVHRDLKPSNVLLDVTTEPHIADFGLARREVGEVTVTVDGQIMGTPSYMSPEQARGQSHEADRRSDVYSLGVMLFEMLTGEKPFRGNVRMLLHQVLHDPAPSPSKLNANIPKDVETICLKCLEKEPHQRYATALELGDDLRAFLDGRPVQARPIGILGRLSRWAKRKPAVAALAAAVLLVSAGGVAGIIWQWRIAQANFVESQQNLTRANAEWRRAEQQRELAEEQRERAEKSQTRAESSFELARGTVQRFLTTVPNHELLQTAGMEPIKRDLQILGRDYYRMLAEARPDEVRVKSELASANFFLAMTREDMGELKEAAGDYLSAANMFAAVAEADPDSPQHERNLAASYGNLANVQINIGQRSEGIETYRRIRDMQQRMVEKNPDDSVSELHLATTILNLATLEDEDGQFEAALASATTAREMCERLRIDHADDSQISYAIAKADFFIGHISPRYGEFEKAAQKLKESVSGFKAMLNPNVENPHVDAELATVYHEIAMQHTGQGREDESEAAWAEAIRHQQNAHEQAPRVPFFKSQLAGKYFDRATSRQKFGRLNEAVADLAEARKLLDADDSERIFMCSARLAAIVQLIDHSAETVPAATTARRNEYAELAIKWLGESIDSGFSDSERLASSEEFSAIRELSDFKELHERLSAPVAGD